MASKHEWDFNCPQYVDFLAGIDSHSADIFFDCNDNFSPVDGKACRNLPVPVNGLTEEAENKLINKMTAALSVIENTPKLKTGVLRGKLFSGKTPGKNIDIHLVKPIVKSAAVHRPSERTRSKSVCVLNKFHTDKPVKAKELKPKRSSSLNDLRAIKKHTYPKTPLCLKRTINAKHKVLKTTEEIELEQIAVLQKQLTQLLRNNEMSFKRMKLRQKPCVQKNMETKSEVPKGNAATNTYSNIRRNFHTMSHTAMKQETLKLGFIFKNKESTDKVSKNICKDILEKAKNPSVSSSIISEECNKSREQVSKKHGNVKYGFHSGLVFTESVKKNSVLKPFKFETKVKDMKAQNAGTDQKAEVSLTRSVSKVGINNGKENFPVTKPRSPGKRNTDVQTVKTDMKLQGLNKKIFGQHTGNLMRGLPLAENTLRN